MDSENPHRRRARPLQATSQDTISRELFGAFNLKPNKFHGHRFRPQLYGPEPTMRDGQMWFRSQFSGYVPLSSKEITLKIYDEQGEEEHTVRKRATNEELEGKDPRKVRQGKTDMFQISYTVAYPSRRREKNVRDLPYIFLMHGVPMNRRLKYEIMKQLGKSAFVVSVDMLGMGDSSMPHKYGQDQYPSSVPPKTQGDKDNFNRAWDWQYDGHYIHLLLKKHLPRKYGLDNLKPWVMQCDDWAAGILMRYICDRQFRTDVGLAIFVNPIFLDGYFVIEIGTIGKLSMVWKMAPDAFLQAALGLPQSMIGIEKYMVLKRWRMNQYTEQQNLGPYQDTNYQGGRIAAFMSSNYWNLVVLADRSSRLAPRQLQPYHRNKNPWGCKTWEVTVPVELIWGMQDQMMPPAQGWRGTYLFPEARVNFTPIDGADHFVEIDQPDKVVRAMWNAMQRELGKHKIPIFLGNGDDVVFKGDEEELIERLQQIYETPDPTDSSGN